MKALLNEYIFGIFSPFVPFSIESYGRIGQPAMKVLHALGDEAAGPGGVTRASNVAGA
jgi:hypothetical protein